MWMVETDGNSSFSVSYSVSLQGSGSQDRIFLVPLNVSAEQARVSFDTPDGYKIVVPWQTEGENTFVVSDTSFRSWLSNLIQVDVLYLPISYPLETRTVGPTTVEFHGKFSEETIDYSCDVLRFLQQLHGGYEHERLLVGDVDVSHYLVPRFAGNGLARHGYPRHPNLPFSNPRDWLMDAYIVGYRGYGRMNCSAFHEFGHLWNQIVLRSGTDVGKWYHDAICNYFEAIGPRDQWGLDIVYEAQLYQAWEYYQTNLGSSIDKPLYELCPFQGDSFLRDVSLMIYSKGMLFYYMLDQEFQERGKDFSNFVSLVYTTFDSEHPGSVDDFIDLASAFAGDDLSGFMDDYLLGNVKYPLDELEAFETSYHQAFGRGSFSGHVRVQDTMTPVAGACIELYPNNLYLDRLADFCCTDVDGSYVITDVLTGTVYAKAVPNCQGAHPDLVDEWYAEGGSTPECVEADPVRVVTHQTTSGIDFALDAMGTITGHVYEEDGVTPVANACVGASAVAPGWNELARFCCTAADGGYTLTGVPAGDVYVKTDVNCQGAHPDLADEWYADGGSTPDGEQATPVHVVGEGITADIDFTLDAAGAISGHVYEGDGVTPIEGADVMAAGPDHHYDYHTTTEADGSYVLHGLSSNIYRVQAVAEGRIREWYWQAYNHWAADLVTVEAPTTTTNINFTLDLAGAISGHVYEQDGATPVSDAWIMVSATAPEWNQLASFCCTGPDGSFTVNHLRAGPAYVKTDVHTEGQHPDLTDEWYADGSSAPDGNQADPVEIVAGETTTGVDFTLDATGSISGHVYEQDGVTPVAGACVNVSATAPEWHQVAGFCCTEANGGFTIEGVPAGDAYVRTDANCQGTHPNLTDEWYAEGGSTLDGNQADPVEVRAGETITGIEFTLDVAGAISGHVYESDGVTPIEGADVMAADPDDQYAYHATTATDGSYTLHGLASNSYRVFAEADGRLRQWYWQKNSHWEADLVTVEVPLTTTGIDFNLARPTSVSGHVYDDEGNPVIGACVSAYHNACALHPAKHFCCTDASGQYSLEELPPGDYALRTHVTCNGSTNPQADAWYTVEGGTADCLAAEVISVTSGTVLEGFDFHLPLREDPALSPPASGPEPTPFAAPIAPEVYRIEYGIRTEDDWHRLWMPVPRIWDGNSMRDLELGAMSPPPSDLYWAPGGTQIGYWELSPGEAVTVTQVFTVELSGMSYDLDETMAWPPYDTTSELYQTYTRPTQWAQSDHPLIVAKAQEIVGTETNPYRIAQAIHTWVANEIRGEWVGSDALTTLVNRGGACGSHANLFAALCRAVGIPARNIAGFVTLESGLYHNGQTPGHIWSEFYLPSYGWVQVDTTGGLPFPGIPDRRLILSKGNNIQPGHRHPCTSLSWMHAPHSDDLNLSSPSCQTWGQGIWLRVLPATALADAIYVDASAGGDTNACGTPGAPCKTISYALNNRAGDGATIRVAQGVYTESFTVDKRVTLEGGYESAGWTRNITQYETIVDGAGSATGQSVGVFQTGSKGTRLDGFTIQNGDAEYGGGAYIADAMITISGTTFLSNTAEYGGAVAVVGSSSVAIEGCQFIGNTAQQNGGGLATFDDAEVTIEDSVFRENSVQEWHGGAIGSYGQRLVMRRSKILNNRAPFGGGLDVAGQVYLEDLEIAGNVATDAGGGVRIPLGGGQRTVVITNTRITTNTASQGGGILVWAGSLEVYDTLIRGNRAVSGNGGGVFASYFESHGSPDLTLTNTLVVSNTSSDRAGALWVDRSPATLVNTTIADNHAGNQCGGLWASPFPTQTVAITNTILWGNGGDDLAGSNYLVSYSDVEEGATGVGNFSLDPLFVDGAAGDYRLRAGSPCIDTGTSLGAPSADLDGNPRPVDGDLDGTARWDVGAYERQLRRIYLPVALKRSLSP